MGYISVRNEGGSGGGGVKTPPYLHRTLAFVLSKGTQGGSLKKTLNIKMSFMNCFKLLSITRNKTCYKDKWVTLKTLTVAYRHIMTHYSRTLTSQEHYDDRSCARPLLSLAKSFK